MSILSRVVSAIAGLFLGAVLGMLVLYFLMLLVGSDFGLDNVRLGAIFGGVIGFLLALRFPERFRKWG
jgi:pimeloyl-ACP methyl ester carboxylesterase